jgi:hypothetical protein
VGLTARRRHNDGYAFALTVVLPRQNDQLVPAQPVTPSAESVASTGSVTVASWRPSARRSGIGEPVRAPPRSRQLLTP